MPNKPTIPDIKLKQYSQCPNCNSKNISVAVNFTSEGEFVWRDLMCMESEYPCGYEWRELYKFTNNKEDIKKLINKLTED